MKLKFLSAVLSSLAMPLFVVAEQANNDEVIREKLNDCEVWGRSAEFTCSERTRQAGQAVVRAEAQSRRYFKNSAGGANDAYEAINVYYDNVNGTAQAVAAECSIQLQRCMQICGSDPGEEFEGLMLSERQVSDLKEAQQSCVRIAKDVTRWSDTSWMAKTGHIQGLKKQQIVHHGSSENIQSNAQAAETSVKQQAQNRSWMGVVSNANASEAETARKPAEASPGSVCRGDAIYCPNVFQRFIKGYGAGAGGPNSSARRFLDAL